MKIAIIGNGFNPKWKGPEAENYHNPSEEIDACDEVWRCNMCRYYYVGFTGWNVTRLFVRSASGIHGRRMTSRYDITIPDGVVHRRPKLIVFGDTERDTYEQATQRYVMRYPPLNQITFIPYAKYNKLVRAAIGGDHRMPTLGALVLVHAMTVYPESEIVLAGFTYRVEMYPKHTHDWDSEEQWVRKLAKEGRVRFLDDPSE